MATYRHWSMSLQRDPDDVSHCRILSSDKAEWRLIPATLCRWRRCFLADQLWFMTCIWEEVRWEHKSKLMNVCICRMSLHASRCRCLDIRLHPLLTLRHRVISRRRQHLYHQLVPVTQRRQYSKCFIQHRRGTYTTSLPTLSPWWIST